MSAPVLTYKLAMAAAQDEGNRHARRNGRTDWNEEDFQAACEKLETLLSIMRRRAIRHPAVT